MYCPFCEKSHNILLERAGPHIKVTCPITNRYLKFITKTPQVLEELQTQEEESIKPTLFDD